MVSCINEVTVDRRRSPFTSYQSTDVSFHFKAPAGPIQRGEGRGEEERLPRLPRKAQMSRVLSHVSLKAFLFQAPESINACIILWIPLFSAAKWLEHPCMKPISNFQSETHPRTTYRSSSNIAAIFDHGVMQVCLLACSAHMCECVWVLK